MITVLAQLYFMLDTRLRLLYCATHGGHRLVLLEATDGSGPVWVCSRGCGAAKRL
jgi:hypothetical protein